MKRKIDLNKNIKSLMNYINIAQPMPIPLPKPQGERCGSFLLL